MSEYQGCDKCKSVGKDRTEFPCSRCIHNAIDHYKPMTNADRIRNMTDEELAEFIDRLTSTCLVDALGVEVEDCGKKECKQCKIEFGSIKEWLQAEVKEGGTDAEKV